MQELQHGDQELVFSYDAEVMSFSNCDFLFSYSVRPYDCFVCIMYQFLICFVCNWIFRCWWSLKQQGLSKSESVWLIIVGLDSLPHHQVCSDDISGSLLLQAPSPHDFDQREMFCFTLFPGSDHLKKVSGLFFSFPFSLPFHVTSVHLQVLENAIGFQKGNDHCSRYKCKHAWRSHRVSKNCSTRSHFGSWTDGYF